MNLRFEITVDKDPNLVVVLLLAVVTPAVVQKGQIVGGACFLDDASGEQSSSAGCFGAEPDVVVGAHIRFPDA